MHHIKADIPAFGGEEPEKPSRSVIQAMARGAAGRCPSCGAGRLFRRYLKVADHCPACGEALHYHRADDAPPYFTIFIAGHLLVPLLLVFERTLAPPLWLYATIGAPLAVTLCLTLLPLVKGAIVGLQWALSMHGFDPDEREEADMARVEGVG